MKKFIESNIVDNSIGLTVVYTLGHILIASACNMVITGASLDLATLDAVIEPCINGIWFYFLHKWYKNYKPKD
jgi:uncharacterized membrane protein